MQGVKLDVPNKRTLGTNGLNAFESIGGTPLFDSLVFIGFIHKVARELIWKLSGDARIGFVVTALWLGEQSPRKAVGLIGPGPHVVGRYTAPMPL